jgi:hypothetical protein
MREDQNQFLTLVGQPPARLSVEQAAWMLGCQTHDMPILIASKLLKPLGNPAPNAIKFFATADILDLVKDRSWLAKITNIISQHWHKRNARQKQHAVNGSHNDRPAVLNLPKAANG